MISNKRAAYLIDKIEEQKEIIKKTGEMMDKATPILECVLPYIQNHQDDIEQSINDFGDLQPALDVMLEFEESVDED